MTSLASPLPDQSTTSHEDMGQAALDFVQRFEIRSVLGDFEAQLRQVVKEKERGTVVNGSPVVEFRPE